ncbi:MAG: DUF6858 family protein [Halothiobacillaceae bacterium]
MKQSILMERYPIFDLELPKGETTMKSVDDIIAYLHAKIEAHPIAAYIGIFDHFAHTKALPEGKIAPEIVDAKLIVFCFGTAIPNPHVMAVRPRSIAVADLGEKFVLSFMEPPMPVATTAMEAWVKELKNV